MELKEKSCIPCQGGVPPLEMSEKLKLIEQIHTDWNFENSRKKLRRVLKFKDMATPMEIAVEIAKLADEQWHHPELAIGYGHLDIEIWTHKIDDLVESDFIFASKVDEIVKKYA